MSESRTKFFFSLCAASKGDESRRDASRRDPFGNTLHAALLGWQRSTLLWLRRKRTASASATASAAASLPSLWAVGQLGKKLTEKLSLLFSFCSAFFYILFKGSANARLENV